MRNTKSNDLEMHVIKRNGKKEIISFDKILKRIKSLGKHFNLQHIIFAQLAMKVIDQLYDNIQTTKIDELTAEQCASMSSVHPDYTKLASAIVVSNLHKNTSDCYYETVKKLYDYRDINNNSFRLIDEGIMNIVETNKAIINSFIDYERDYAFDFFGFKTLERAYLMRCNKIIVERPQHMLMRVALTIHGSNMEKVKETYDYMSQKYFIHATPTLFNAGSPRPQLSSCYLLSMESDSIEGIFNTLKECAQISKWSGGIGLHVHNIRSSGAYIKGTNGTSNGLIPMLGVFNKTARYVDQGGKRNGSFAIYIEPHHPDIEDFLDLKKNHGDEESKCRDLFYALWISDLFMERVMGNKVWSLFCPDKCPGLSDCHSEAFRELYSKYEDEGKFNKQINARDLWIKILDSQMETGTPYLLYKDAANAKSNQKNLGTIKSSNLCVAPETLVLTKNGQLRIDTLVNQEVDVWNGECFSKTTICQTSACSELIEVHTSDGCVLSCTKYHKFYIQDKSYISDKSIKGVKLVEAQDLKNGMAIIETQFPIISNNNIILDAYNIGFNSSSEFVPINYSLNSKIMWLSGYVDNVGITSFNKLIINNECKQYMMNIKYMLQTCGLNVALIYSDHYKHFISLSYSNVILLNKLGFMSEKSKLLVQENTNVNTNYEDRNIYITNVVDNKRTDKTYCFNEQQKHAGIFNGLITSQCTEIIEYSDSQETAVCNLASLGLPMYISEDKSFDYEKLYQVVQVVVSNLNNVIDINYYPTPKTRRSNFKHRPVGIGIQGLADVFFKMDLAFTSDQAKEINIKIFETIYYAALEKSMLLSKQRLEYMRFLKEQYYLNNWTFITDEDECREYNIYNVSDASIHLAIENDKLIEKALASVKPVKAEIDNLDSEFLGAYSSFKGSPASYGQLQFDLWNVTPSSGRYDWTALKENIMTYGIRNSLLVAPMPTASTSQILGNNECFEPITSNIYSRKTLAGDFVLVNKYLVEDLLKLGLWNEDLKNSIIANKGSVSHIQNLVPHLKEKYKTVWELPMKEIINMSRDRGAYICQSQSLNLWIEDPDSKILTSMHFYSWKAGLKTGIYYLRRKAKHQAQQFTIEPKNKGEKGDKTDKEKAEKADKEKADKDDDEDDKKECLMCSG
jgi:ribonucleotide reductase alpha subunit